MENSQSAKPFDWRGSVVTGLVGFLLFIAGLFSRMTNPPFPWVLSFALVGLGLFGLWLFYRSGVRERELRLTPSLDGASRRRLREQRPLSIILVLVLFVLIPVPFSLTFFVTRISPMIYNGVIGACFLGIIIWCVTAAIGHSARHRILDEHEQALVTGDRPIL